MGGQPSKPTRQWADSPFKLIETPRRKLGRKALSQESGAFACANEMALVHNCLIRALNCIYLQAPNVHLPKDISDFLEFMQSWSLFVHMHHETEESVFFPLIENYIGMPGFMEKNVEQHHGFGPGMGAYDDYLKACQEGKETFDGEKVRKIVDSFGAIFTQHLTEEIDTLLALEEYSDKIDWPEFNKKVQQKAVEQGDPVCCLFPLPFCVLRLEDVGTQHRRRLTFVVKGTRNPLHHHQHAFAHGRWYP
jgi:hemerythrin-like domain-containing protein